MFVYFWLDVAQTGKIEQYIGCGNKTAGDWNCFLNEFVTLMVTKQSNDVDGLRELSATTSLNHLKVSETWIFNEPVHSV
jgi:hypothetical protein